MVHLQVHCLSSCPRTLLLGKPHPRLPFSPQSLYLSPLPGPQRSSWGLSGWGVGPREHEAMSGEKVKKRPIQAVASCDECDWPASTIRPSTGRPLQPRAAAQVPAGQRALQRAPGALLNRATSPNPTRIPRRPGIAAATASSQRTPCANGGGQKKTATG